MMDVSQRSKSQVTADVAITVAVVAKFGVMKQKFIEKLDCPRCVNGFITHDSALATRYSQACDWCYGTQSIYERERQYWEIEQMTKNIEDNPSSIRDLCDFVTRHIDRGPAGDVDQAQESMTSDMVMFNVIAVGNPTPEKLRQLIVANKQGVFCDLDPFDGKEHSYIEVGAWIGSQSLALSLMGLGEILGLWPILTPKRLGLPDDLIQLMVGQGMITIMPPSNAAMNTSGDNHAQT